METHIIADEQSEDLNLLESQLFVNITQFFQSSLQPTLTPRTNRPSIEPNN